MAAFSFFQLAEEDCFKAMILLRSWSHDHVMRLHHLLQEPTCRDVTVERLISRVKFSICLKPTLDDHTDFFRVSEETAKLEQTTVWSATGVA